MDRLDKALLFELIAWRQDVLHLIRSTIKHGEPTKQVSDLCDKIYEIDNDCEMLLEYWEKYEH